MIFITQLVYLKEGQENIFHQFEDIAIPRISKYNGKLLLRVRPTENTVIEHHVDRPYEIHLVEFDTEQDFENFKQDALLLVLCFRLDDSGSYFLFSCDRNRDQLAFASLPENWRIFAN